jgi:uncharacterized Fe-S cluster-containing MiaB family protein
MVVLIFRLVLAYQVKRQSGVYIRVYLYLKQWIFSVISAVNQPFSSIKKARLLTALIRLAIL